MDAPDSTHESLRDSTGDALDLSTADITGTPRRPIPLSDFAEGALIANRFRIIRLLGKGGMGEVYEALDIISSEHVAVKTLRSEIAKNEKLLQRFLREAQISRKVTHPNVCRLNDIYQHDTGHGRLLCVSMELLRGESLSDYLERKGGPLTVDDALPIIQQMAIGIGAAHRAGVIHRDFKSSNVMLVNGKDGLRVVVTDFGLARAEREDESPSLTEEGDLLFTPAYVAPEQLQPGQVTAAADIYSFGVVLYEMMTGRLPFKGATRMETALARLQVAPAAPRSLNPKLPRHWDAVILRCLEIKPANRFSSAEAASTALSAGAPVLIAKKQIRKHSRIAVTSLLLIGLLVGWLWFSRHMRIMPASAKRRSVCVMEPVSMDGNTSAKSTVSQITQLLINDLEAVNSLRVVPHYRVAQARLDLGTAGESELTPASLNQIRTQMDSDYVVSGTYTRMSGKDGPVLRVDLKVYDAQSGEMTAALSATGPENAPLELQNELSNQLRTRLGVRMMQKGDAEHLLANIPPDPAAQKLYSDGVDKLHHYDSAGALTLLKQVTQISPKFPLAHLDLAEAYANLGYDAHARDEAEQARSLLAGFPDEKKTYVEARSHELAREWNSAIDLYTDLVRSYPDNPEYWLRLAVSQGSAGQNAGALQTIAKARDTLHTEDPRFALAETDIVNHTGNFQKTFEAAQRATASAERVNATSLEAKAWVMQCWAALNLGRPTDARTDCAKGAALSQKVNDQATLARALNNTANALLKEGKISEAENLYQEVFQILEQIGDEKNLGGAHLNYGNALFNRSDFSGAEREYRLSLATAQKRQDKTASALASTNIAGVLMAQGRLPEAEKLYVDALAIARSVGAEITIARCLNNLGLIQASRGDLDAAMSSYNEALGMRTKLGSEDGRAVVLTEMGDLLTEEDELEQAKVRYNEALSIQQRLGERDDIARTKLSLAKVAVFENSGAAALPLLHDATASLEDLSDSTWSALGHSLSARVLNDIGDRKQALQEIEKASRMLGNTEEVDTRMDAQLNCAEVRASDSKASAQLRRPLEEILAQASKQGLLEPQLRARMILAQLKGGRDSESRRMLLEGIKMEAQARGLKLLAREVQSLY